MTRHNVRTADLNPFSSLDDGCKPFFKKGEEVFNLRIVTKEETFRKQEQAIAMLSRLAEESIDDLGRSLESLDADLSRSRESINSHESSASTSSSMRPRKIRDEDRPKELWRPTDEWISKSFETDANRTVFIIEDKNKKPVLVCVALIDDPVTREKMKVPDDVGTYVYIAQVITEKEFKGLGIFSLMLNKMMTMLSSPKRNLKPPIEYAISVTSMKVENDNMVMNLPRYAKMWSNRFEDNNLQIRLQALDDTTKQEGRDNHPLDSFLDEEGSLYQPAVSQLIESRKSDAAKEDKFVRGLILHGKNSKDYDHTKKWRLDSLKAMKTKEVTDRDRGK